MHIIRLSAVQDALKEMYSSWDLLAKARWQVRIHYNAVQHDETRIDKKMAQTLHFCVFTE